MRRHHTTALSHTSLPLSQVELAASTSSFGNALSHRLPSRAETKALNSHHRRRLPSLDRPTPTLHYYKMIISTLVTLITTQLRLHSTSSLARAPRHRSSTRRPSIASQITYRHVNSHKKYFEMSQHHAGL
jgi:hypothetical protein